MDDKFIVEVNYSFEDECEVTHCALVKFFSTAILPYIPIIFLVQKLEYGQGENCQSLP
jgi:hypothetical protein